MSLQPPPEQVVAYLPNGKEVCFDHHLRRCDICCLDFAYGQSDDEDELNRIDHQEREVGFWSGDESDEDDHPERVFVLTGGTARFMPQWDGQVLGPGNTFQIEKDYENPPKPLPRSDVSTCYCATCQLTWLVGETGEAAARSHPSHHSYTHIYAGTRRSLLVFTDGACSGNGTPGARGGLGIFFGPGSSFNLAERLANPGIQTSQKAELAAVIRALEIIRSDILPRRRIMVTGAEGGRNRDAVSDAMGLRVVIATDSSYIVEGMCRHFLNWKENEQGVLVNKAGKVVENSEGFLRLKNEVNKLSMVGVQVAYYLVPRTENDDADALAKGSIA
ncbi:hypothetical protein BP6252_12089 [Coleophoma cylindrospora]|uniref:ribonuclease H n=1 Tax=Coleophoma cylindrospora TaxID=1849047 RepID=A0A3D8QFS3_9HELO|nr:hypothetical protein BP6252_12089 [Coleophoma cylindrospora]